MSFSEFKRLATGVESSKEWNHFFSQEKLWIEDLSPIRQLSKQEGGHCSWDNTIGGWYVRLHVSNFNNAINPHSLYREVKTFVRKEALSDYHLCFPPPFASVGRDIIRFIVFSAEQKSIEKNKIKYTF